MIDRRIRGYAVSVFRADTSGWLVWITSPDGDTHYFDIADSLASAHEHAERIVAELVNSQERKPV